MNENEIYAVEETNEVDVIEVEETGEIQYRQPSYTKKVLAAVGIGGTILAGIALKRSKRVKKFFRKQALKYLKKTGGINPEDVNAEDVLGEVVVEEIDVTEEE